MTVIRIIAEQARFDPAQLRLDATPAALGLDSLGLVEMVFALEEAFDIRVPFNANPAGPQTFDTATVGTVVAAVRALVADKP